MLSLDVRRLLAEAIGTAMTVGVEERERLLGDDLAVAFLRGEVHFLRTDYGLFARGDIATRVSVECVRCLAPMDYPLIVQLADHFAHHPRALSRTYDAVFPILRNGMVDLEPVLREHVLLDLPFQPLCRPDCRGLCSQCGANLNEGPCECAKDGVDPRLAALRGLL